MAPYLSGSSQFLKCLRATWVDSRGGRARCEGWLVLRRVGPRFAAGALLPARHRRRRRCTHRHVVELGHERAVGGADVPATHVRPARPEVDLQRIQGAKQRCLLQPGVVDRRG